MPGVTDLRELQPKAREALIAAATAARKGEPVYVEIEAVADHHPSTAGRLIRDLRAVGLLVAADKPTARIRVSDAAFALVEAAGVRLPAPPKERRCLCCRKAFRSLGPHNHVCDPCKRTAAWESGF